MKRFLPGIVVLLVAAICGAQVSIEEAQRRLREKMTTRPSTTQPVTEIDRLRAENRRLREQNTELQTEVSQLRDALATAAGGAASRPAAAAQTQPGSDLASKIIGRWMGGSVAAGNAFDIEFQAEGNYVQNWTVAPRAERGHYNFTDGQTLEMWTGNATHHNQYRVSISAGELTLTPLVIEGGNLPRGKPMVLKSAS